MIWIPALQMPSQNSSSDADSSGDSTCQLTGVVGLIFQVCLGAICFLSIIGISLSSSHLRLPKSEEKKGKASEKLACFLPWHWEANRHMCPFAFHQYLHLGKWGLCLLEPNSVQLLHDFGHHGLNHWSPLHYSPAQDSPQGFFGFWTQCKLFLVPKDGRTGWFLAGIESQIRRIFQRENRHFQRGDCTRWVRLPFE